MRSARTSCSPLSATGRYVRILGDGPPTFLGDRARRFATSEFNALTQAELRLSMNASRGYGGASFNDSGGPIFLGHSTTVAAIVGLRGNQERTMVTVSISRRLGRSSPAS